MKAFFKTLIGGALGVGALYIVGKVCFEAGKNVAEVEHQLADSKHVSDLEKYMNMNLDNSVIETDEDGNSKIHHQEKIECQTEANDRVSKSKGFREKIKNAKLFLTLKKTFDKRDRKPGILGSLLTNPDGAKIEAIVKDGGVQVSIKPRAA